MMYKYNISSFHSEIENDPEKLKEMDSKVKESLSQGISVRTSAEWCEEKQSLVKIMNIYVPDKIILAELVKGTFDAEAKERK